MMTNVAWLLLIPAAIAIGWLLGRRGGEIKGGAKGRIGVNIVVVRHFFTAILASLSDAGNSTLSGGAINRRSLVGVLAIAKNVAKLSLDLYGWSKAWV